jgi:hypothetical protein
VRISPDRRCERRNRNTCNPSAPCNGWLRCNASRNSRLLLTPQVGSRSPPTRPDPRPRCTSRR